MEKLNSKVSPTFQQDGAATTRGTAVARVSGGQVCFRGGLSEYLMHLKGWLKELISDVQQRSGGAANTRQSIFDWLNEADLELWDGHPRFDECAELFDEVARWAVKSRPTRTLLKLLKAVGMNYFLQLG